MNNATFFKFTAQHLEILKTLPKTESILWCWYLLKNPWGNKEVQLIPEEIERDTGLTRSHYYKARRALEKKKLLVIQERDTIAMDGKLSPTGSQGNTDCTLKESDQNGHSSDENGHSSSENGHSSDENGHTSDENGHSSSENGHNHSPELLPVKESIPSKINKINKIHSDHSDRRMTNECKSNLISENTKVTADEVKDIYTAINDKDFMKFLYKNNPTIRNPIGYLQYQPENSDKSNFRLYHELFLNEQHNVSEMIDIQELASQWEISYLSEDWLNFPLKNEWLRIAKSHQDPNTFIETCEQNYPRTLRQRFLRAMQHHDLYQSKIHF